MNLLVEKRNLIVGILLLSGSIITFSQSKTDSVTHLREVTITQKALNPEIKSATPVQILSEKKIQTLNALLLSDAVKHFPGVTIKDYGGIGGLKTISVRGLGATHTAVVYDGIAVSDVQTGQIDIGRFTLDNVQSISLNSGQTDQIFQPARMFASASVLSIQTQKPVFSNRNITGKISMKAGSFGLINPSFTFHGKINRRLSASFNGDWLSANGKYPYTLHYGTQYTDSSSVEIRKNTDVKNIRLEGTLFAGFSEKSNGYLKAQFFNSERGLPGAVIFYNDKSTSSQRLQDNSFFTQANFTHRFSNRWAAQANAKFNRSGINYTDSAWMNSAQVLENTYNQREIYGSSAVMNSVTENLSFSAASDVSLNTMEANLHNFAYPGRLTWQSSLASKYATNRISLTGSLLLTQTYESVKSGVTADNQKKVSPFVSFSVKPLEEINFRIRSFYKNIFRMPSFNDLYYLRTGERKLRPEDAHQINLGITYSLSKLKWLENIDFSADMYHNRIKNKIVAKPSASLFEWTMTNFGTVHITGLDLHAEALIAFSEDISVETGVNYSYQHAVDMTDETNRTYGHQLPYTPFHSGSGRVNLINQWVNIAYSVIWSGVRYSNAQNYTENRLPAYSDHSISLNKTFIIDNLTFRPSIEFLNIFNKNYEVIRGFPMPGRSFRINITVNI